MGKSLVSCFFLRHSVVDVLSVLWWCWHAGLVEELSRQQGKLFRQLRSRSRDRGSQGSRNRRPQVLDDRGAPGGHRAPGDRKVQASNNRVAEKVYSEESPPPLRRCDDIILIGRHAETLQTTSCGNRPLFDSTLSVLHRCWKWCSVCRCFFFPPEPHVGAHLVVGAQRCIYNHRNPLCFCPSGLLTRYCSGCFRDSHA